MAQNFYCTLTEIGEAKDAKAKALGLPFRFAEMGVGDGNGTVPVPDKKRTKLVNEVRRAPLNQVSLDPKNGNQVIVEQVIPENVGGWWIREQGLYDEDGDLVAIGNCPPTYKPQMSEGSGKTQVIRMVIVVTSAATVELKIDPSVVLATRSYLESYAAQKVHGHNPADVIPGGLVGQILRKKSNGSGDVEWADLTDGVKINVNTVEESITLAAGQIVVDLAKVTTNGVVVYIGGARLDKGLDYVINSQSRITLAKPYPNGTRMAVAQNETAGTVVNPLDSSKNLADVADVPTARKNLSAAPALTGVPMKWPTLDCPAWALVRDGSAYPRASYPALFDILAPLRAGAITQNANGAIVSGLSRTSDLWVGMPYEHATLPAGTTIKSIDSTNQVTLTNNATASTANAQGRFFLHGYGNGGGAATFGIMDDRGLFDRSLDQGSRAYEKSVIDAVLVAGSVNVTGLLSTRGLFVGQPVAGTGLQANTTIASISAAGITLSLPAASGGATALTVTGGQIGCEREDSLKSHSHNLQSNTSVGGGTGWYFQNGSGGFVGPSAGQVIAAGAAETRPRNRNYLPIIAY
ncbi:phage tail protein [Herbaspirillum seropedicae]|uniref:phage tail protein n=1 Tax=Herbaspirillum seropedicae TaxID=964 RepID=UPI002866DCF0|nr:phage tail protein [Herbaspirillum seropedicae]MDR6397300.1 hypothetical protein [Herbaspirillum seropedicae]